MRKADPKMARKRKLPTGMIQRGNVYHSCFRAGGRLIRKRLSTDLKAATEILNDLRARADRADFNLIDNDYPWNDLRKEFLAWARQAIRNPDALARDLDLFEEQAKPRTVRDVTPQAIFAYRDWRASHRCKIGGKPVKSPRPITPRTINKEVGTVSHMLNMGVTWGKISSNPIKAVKQLRHDNPFKQRRPLTVEEIQAIFAASPEHLRRVWLMFVSTGIRLGELVNMKFADVDFDAKEVIIRASTAKNHKARTIPLDDTMLATIAELKAAAPARFPVPGKTRKLTEQQAARFSREHVFVSSVNTTLGNNLLVHFYAICGKAGIEGAHRCGNVDIHSLRVTFATLTLGAGANPKDIQALLGHSTLTMTMNVYGKATSTGKRAAVNLLPFVSASGPEHVLQMPQSKPIQTPVARKALTDGQTNDSSTAAI